MPTNEYSRAEFLRALLNQQKRNTALGGSLVNPSVDNGSDLANSALIDTTIAGKTPINGDVASFDVEKATEEKSRAGHTGNSFIDSLDNIFGFVDEIAAKFGAGFVGAWEGILDLGATAIGALGDATGWYDSDPFTKWAAQDIGTAASEYIKTYVNLNPWSWIRKAADGTYSNQQYWNDMFEGGKDILGSALFLDNNLNDYREDSDKYYRYNDESLTDMGQFGEFVGGAAHSIGFMLPSIMTGGIAGGSTKAAQAISLGSMGVMAAGKGSEEALNDGADAGRALGYGLASGAVEVAGEIVVGKALKVAGLGTGKIMGVIGKGASSTTVKVGSKTFVKELGKTMFEEGMEEVFSAVLEPATKAIYKGTDAFNNTYTNPDWWLGTNGHFNESVVGQFASGAFVGGLSGAAHTAPVYKKLGSTNYNTIQSFSEVVEVDSQMAKMESQKHFDKNSPNYQQLINERAEAMSNFIENLNESIQKSSQSQNEYLLELLTNKGTLQQALADSKVGDTDANTIVKNYLNEITNKHGTHEKSLISSLDNRLQARFGTNYSLEYVSDSDMVKLYGKQGADIKTKGFFDSKTNKIVLNESLLNTQGGKTLVHEYFAHGLSKAMSKGNVRIMFNDIINSDIGKQLAKELKESKNYNFKNVSNSNLEFQEELLGQFLEQSFDGKNVATQIHNLEKTFNPSKLDRFLTNILDAFNKTNKFKSNKVAKEYAKVLNQWLKYGDNNKNIVSKTLRKIVYKEYSNIELNSYEKSIKAKYSKLVSLLENQLGEQIRNELSDNKLSVAYSKFLTEQERIVSAYSNTKTTIDFSLKSRYTIEELQKIKNLDAIPKSGNYVIFSNAFFGDALKKFLPKEKVLVADTAHLYKNLNNRKYVTDYADLNSREGESWHNLSPTEYEKAINSISNPQLISRRVSDKSSGYDYAVLTNAKDNQGRPLLVVIEENHLMRTNGQSEPFNVYRVKSVYPKDNMDIYISSLQYKTANKPSDGEIVYQSSKIKSSQKTGPIPAAGNNNNLNNKNNDVKFSKDITDTNIVETEDIDTKEYKQATNALYDINADALNYEEYLIGETDYREAYLSKRYVNKLNKKAGDVLDILRNYYDGDTDIDFDYFDYEKVKQTFEEFANDDYIESINEIIGQIDSSEYPQDNPPDYSNLEDLVGYLEDLQNNFDEVKLGYEKYTEENDIQRILKESRTRSSESTYLRNLSSSEWKRADVGRISELSKRLLREEYDSVGNTGRLDIIQDSTGKEYLVGAYNYTYNNLQKILNDFEKSGTWESLKTKQMLSEHGLDDFKNARFTITSADGLSTLTVLANGDIVNVLNLSQQKGFVSKALPLAIDNGGITMDNYNIPRGEDNTQGNLTWKYAKQGFAPVSATPYNAEFVNETIRDRFTKMNGGEPIVFMKYTGHNEQLFDSYEQLQAYIHSEKNYVLQFNDWNDAETKRNRKTTDVLYESVQEFKKNYGKDDFDVKAERKAVKQIIDNIVADIKAEQEATAPKSTPSIKPTITFKSIRTTEDIVLKSSDYIKGELGKGFEVHYPDNFDNLSSKAFTSINNAKLLDTQAKRLTNILLDTQITQDGKVIGTLDELLSASDIAKLQTSVADIIKSSPDTEARSKATLPFEKALDRAIRNVRNAKTISGRAHVWQNLRNSIHNQYNSYLDLTGDSVAKGGYLPLLNIFNETHWNGSSSYKLGNLRNVIESAIELYSEESIKNNFGGLQYSPEIHDALLDLEASLPSRKTITDKAGNVLTRDVSLDANTIENLIRLGRLVKRQINNQIIKDATEIRPSVRQTVRAIERMSYSQRKGLASRLFRSWKRGFAPAYAVLEEMLGSNSTLANKVIYDMQDGLNKQKLYKGSYTDLLNKKLKELNLRKTFNKKTFTIDGKVMNADQALSLYISLNVEANKTEIAKNGFQYILPDSKSESKLSTKITVDDIDALQSEVNRVLPENYRKLGDFLLETMNGSVKSEYMKMFEDKFGKYVGRNEIGKVGDKSYWMLFRAYQKATNVEKAMTNPAGVFSHAKARVDTQNAVLLTGALSSFTSYIDSLSSEIYVKPVYRDVISILNTKTEKGVNGQTVSQLLAQKVGSKDFDYLMTTLGNILGVNQKSGDVFSRVVSTFSVAKLSMNIGSVLKQYGAAWTSNIPINKSTKALVSRLFRNANVRAEYNELINELGGLKYRESSKTILRANADAPAYLPDKIADFGMWGMSKADMFTTSTGVVGLMYIAQDQMGLKIGTSENKQWVKQHWAEFELSQPGGSPLSQNAVSRGDFGAITKAIFGFMQGDNRAALGSIIHKLGLYDRNKNVNISDLRSQYKNAQTEFENAKVNYDSDTTNDTYREDYIKAKTNVEDLRMRIKDYESFKIAGGKKIKLNIGAGLLVQAVFVSLINELLKHIKGKEDWDEWEFMDNKLWLLNVVKEGSIDWLPLINVFSNAFVGDLSLDNDGNFEWSDGYGVQVPVVEVANNLVDTFTYFKNGNYKSGLTNLVSLAGDMTGLPFTTLRSYAYGIIKNFNPEIAEKVKNVFYNTTDDATISTLDKYADKGDFNTSKGLIKHAIENFRSGYASERVNTELTNLYINGYNALPKEAMTSYINENGATVNLSSQQIATFKKLYSQSDSSVQKLLQSSEYQSLTQEEKAKLIKKIYDAYYDYAKVKVVGGSASSKIAQILTLTNGNINLGTIIAILNKVSQIKENSRKSRKELVIEYINKLTSLSKQEKILAMYLAGYSVSGNSQNQLVSYLTSKGASKNAVLSLISN